MDKKVLEHEVAALAEPPSRRAAEPPSSPAAEPALPRTDGARAELALLRLMIANGEWRERAAEGVPPEWFEHSGHRELFDKLREVRGEGPAPMPDGLSREGQARWSRLLALVGESASEAQDRVFEGACRVLQARPHFRRLEQVTAQLARATAETQAELMREQLTLNAELRRQFPDEFEQRYGWRRLRRRAGNRPGRG